MSPRETDFVKREIESDTVEPFVESYRMVTGRSLEILEQRESPDFETLMNGQRVGIELTEIRGATDGFSYMDEVVRLASKKGDSYRGRGLFTRPIFLVCHSKSPALFDIHRELEFGVWDDLEVFGFAEIWLMDLSDEYYSPRDWRRPADLFCVTPDEQFGFHRVAPDVGRKPFG
jgi:hypothetical protein